MKEKIFKNFSLKILSAICAIVLWAVIVNIYDPTTGYTIANVTVQLTNTEALTDKDYTYEVVDGSKISVYVSGPKSVVTDIKSSDIVAVADLSKITTFADYVDIDVKVVKDGVTLTNVEVTPKTTAVKLNIENRVTQTFNIEYETTGSVAADHIITSQSISPTTVKITGPTSSVANVAHVKAIYDLADASSDIDETITLQLYDYSGNVIDDSKLELSKTDVDYVATVRSSKEVRVNYSISGTVASGYSVSSVSATPEYVTLAGNKDVLDSISEITIPADEVNVEGLTSDKTFQVLLTDYIPNNVKLVSDSYVSIRVKVEDSSSKSVSISTSDISINGLDTGYTASITTQNAIDVSVSGSSDVMDSISPTGLKPYINLEGLGEGEQTVPLNFELPNGCSITGSYTVQVQITKSESATETESTSTSTTTG